ncbi:hypothetical protein [Candidatus Mesenet endosymbiont of Phosphuga atrata]|uniref:hypothetical protein n=1 Tax=Candidatus Mesenet endosymbiont of Phosphuga atrata TaxID=3066221 RepID=UPI0030D20A31
MKDYIENMDKRRENIRTGKKRERISMIGGWIGKKFIAPLTFTGGCDKEVLNLWLEQILLPQLQCDSYG